VRLPLALWILLLIPAVSVGATEPSMNVVVEVKRYSEFKLTPTQVATLDEATKISAATSTFHGLYGRWPKDIEELAARSDGIDIDVFDGKILIENVEQGVVLTFFDGRDVRRLRVSEDSPVSAEMRELATDPAFRMHISLKVKSSEVLPTPPAMPGVVR
jgi:hypothetical protein